MWQEWVFYWLSPFILALQLWLAAIVCLGLARRRLALVLSVVGFAGLWAGSTPVLADWMTGTLEAQYPAMAPEASPTADAVVVLGGALAVAAPPARPTFILGQSATRIWHAAALYRAGKARWIVIAAGNRPEHEHLQPEADAIAEILGKLGVPATAIKRDTRSRTTRENAANVQPILQALGARRVLLVTSAFHMPRAMRTVEAAWSQSGIEVIPAATDVRVLPQSSPTFKLWLPSLDALIDVTKALKEFAGMAALAIIQ